MTVWKPLQHSLNLRKRTLLMLLVQLLVQLTSSTTSQAVGMSPGKTAEIRSNYMEQLQRYT